LINQLDGFDPRGNIKVLMATNRSVKHGITVQLILIIILDLIHWTLRCYVRDE
jgi:hypothetical protein